MRFMIPTGFRFSPTDEELIEILERKASGQELPLHFNFIVERNVYAQEPKDLQWEQTSVVSDNERYCFCMKKDDSREVLGQGWWKATSHVKKVYANNMHLVGYKRPLTFYKFTENEKKRDKAIKTNWIMHEYSLQSHKMEWRLCKMKYKGKPSVQEELENIRQVYKVRNDFEATSSSSSVMDMQADQPQPSFDQLIENVYEPIVSTNNYFGEQLEQPADISEELFDGIWSWQNY